MSIIPRYEGLDPSDDDLIEQPNKTTALASKVVTTTEVTSSGPSYVPDNKNNLPQLTPPGEPGEIPNIDAEFQLLEGSSKKIIELKEIEEQLEGSNGISQEEASTIHDFTGDFFGPRIRMEEFTVSKSKTNYMFAKNFVKTKLANEQQQLVSSISQNFVVYLQNAQAQVNTLSGTWVKELINDYDMIARKDMDTVQKVLDSKNVVFPVGNDFVNIVTTRFIDATLLNVTTSMENAEILLSCRAIAIAACKKELSYFLNAVILNKPISEIYDGCSAIVSDEVNNASLGHLLEMLSNGMLINFIKNLFTAFNSPDKGLAAKIGELISGMNQAAQNSSNVAQYVTDNRDVIDVLNPKIQFANNLFNQLSILKYSLVDFLQKVDTLG